MGSAKESLKQYESYLKESEKSPLTIDKYIRDVRSFLFFAGESEISKQSVLDYRERLRKTHTAASVNTVLSAVNGYLKFIGRTDCQVKLLRVQRRAFTDTERELTEAEYHRLVEAAKDNERLSLVIRTICATGIRVSELKFITTEAIDTGKAEVSLKGKQRIIFIPKELKKLLKRYTQKNNIKSGSVFVTMSGKALNRSNIWKSMKKLCEAAGVNPQKVFPHNLRHLFARSFYRIERDIARLADILGHSSIETTRIYIMTSGKEHERILNRMKLVC